MIGYIYLTENLENGRFYVGQKRSLVFNPDYLGSGTALRAAVKKYGKDRFVVKMIDTAQTAEELNAKEVATIAALDAVFDRNFYNINEGGWGGGPWSVERREAYALRRREEVRQGINVPPPATGFTEGDSHSEHSKAIIGVAVRTAHTRARQRGVPYHTPSGAEALRLNAFRVLANEKALALRALSSTYQAEMQRRRDDANERYADLPEMLKTMSQSEAAAILGVDQSAVAQRVREHNIAVEHDESYHAKIQGKREAAAKLAHAARRAQGDQTWAGFDLLKMAETMTQVQIGKIVGVSQVRVSQRLRELRGVTGPTRVRSRKTP